MSSTLRAQRGGGKLQATIALLVLIALAIVGLRVIPVYINAYALRDHMRNQAKFAGLERKPLDVIQGETQNKAQELDLPVDRSHIHVEYVSGGIKIVTTFTVPVNLVFFNYNLKFSFTEDTRTAY